jgi:hypothetical protein
MLTGLPASSEWSRITRVAVARLWCRAELRRRWVQHLTVALLVGFVGAAVLTCVAAARRTDSVYERYVRTQAVPQLEFPLPEGASDAQIRTIAEQIRAVDGVAAAGSYDSLFAVPDVPDVLPGNDFQIFTPLDDQMTRTVDRPILVEGHMPAAVDEVMVNERARERFGLRPGSTFTIRSIPVKDADAMRSGDFANVTFEGPQPTLRVTGVGRTRVDLTGSTYVNQYALSTPAFAEKYRPQIYGYGGLTDITLEPEADRDAVTRALQSVTETSPNPLDEGGSAFTDTARMQSIALALIGLTALIAGAFVISQAIGRMIRNSRPDLLALRELGLSRGISVVSVTAEYVPAAIAGTVLALVGAALGSMWFPTGLVGRAEVTRGVQVDGVVFGVGALAIVLLVVARALVGAIRATAAPREIRATRTSWTDRVGNALSPASGTGVRWAVGRAEGTRPTTAILATVIGIAGLLAVTTYTQQLDHVVATPATWGMPADAGSEVGDDPAVLAELRKGVEGLDAVDDISVYTLASRVDVDDVTMQVWAFDKVRGNIEPTIVAGRAPTRDTEAMLGTKTVGELNVAVGDTVRVVGTNKDPYELTVVGTGLFPNSDTDEIATGIVTTRRVLAALAPEEPRSGVVWNWKDGGDIDGAIETLSERGADVSPPTVPPDIANMRILRSYPWWLAAFLVILAILACSNALIVSSRRRRHEMAVLGALGFRRGQLRGALATQGVTVGVLASAIGIPLGLLVGKWVWTTHAERIGLGSTIALPLGYALAVAIVTLAITPLLAIACGRGALRGRLATALRSE